MPSVRPATSIQGRAHVRRQTRGRVRADDSRLEPAFRAPSAGGPCRQAPRISWHRPARATNRQAPREHAAPSGPAIDSTAATPAYPTPPTISATQTKAPRWRGRGARGLGDQDILGWRRSWRQALDAWGKLDHWHLRCDSVTNHVSHEAMCVSLVVVLASSGLDPVLPAGPLITPVRWWIWARRPGFVRAIESSTLRWKALSRPIPRPLLAPQPRWVIHAPFTACLFRILYLPLISLPKDS